MHKGAAPFFIALLVTVAYVTLSGVHLAGAAGTIYIRADGSIDPPTAPIFTSDLTTYMLTDDIYDSIVVQRSNILIDGNGHIVTGSGTGRGFDLYGMSNVTIVNTEIRGFEYGIYLENAIGNTISGNAISNSTYNGSYLGGSGVILQQSSNNTISGNTFTGNAIGICLHVGADYNNVSKNLVTANTDGINQEYGSFNTLSENSVTLNDIFGMRVRGGCSVLRNNRMIANSYNFNGRGYLDVDTSNTVDGKPIYFWTGRSDDVVPSDAGCVALIGCFNITVKGLTLARNYCGVLLEGSENCTITGNQFEHNLRGVALHLDTHWTNLTDNNITDNLYYGVDIYFSSHYNVICRNDIAGNGVGICIYTSAFNTIYENRIRHNWHGVKVQFDFGGNIVLRNDISCNEDSGIISELSEADNLTVSENTIVGNLRGVNLEGANGCLFSGNLIAANVEAGLSLDSCSQTTVHHNIMINPVQVVASPTGPNMWDDGYPSGGNYWNDYNGSDLFSGVYQNETGSDGIGDSPYAVGNEADRYPLVLPEVFFLDVNEDGIIDMRDIYLVAIHFGELPTSPDWTQRADVDFNLVVNMLDLYKVATHYGETA